MLLTVAADTLRDYEKYGYARSENNLQKFAWLLTTLLLTLAYVPPWVLSCPSGPRRHCSWSGYQSAS